jgi:hypothetical protein
VRPIDGPLVDEVWAEIIRFPAEQIQGEAQAFLERQPHVAAFTGVLTRELEAPVRLSRSAR